MKTTVFLVGFVSFLTLVLAAPQFTSADDPVPLKWPCPLEYNIDPCVCMADEFFNLTMNCSLVQSTADLERIFQELFPFIHFLELIIDHDPTDITNQLEEIRAHTFNEVTFERIIIRGTQLSLVADEAFANSHEYLRYLDLSNNQLSAYPFESLPEYEVLQTFIIDDNHILELPSLDSASLEVFSGSGNNNMQVIALDQFSLAPNLREIHLSRIGMTSLNTGMFQTLSKLEVIDLSDNHLNDLELFAIMVPEQTLATVNLNYNYINYIRHEAIVGLNPSAHLLMSHNNVTELKQDQWEHIFHQISEGKLNLAENPLTCGCDMDWIMLDDDNSFLPIITDTTTCYGGQLVIFLEIDNFCSQCQGNWVVCP
ncbi:hypothetical protein Pcinc_001640 [Petrolisthes cinctipes]|uniref:Oplophorus-luciferin 2-monooxygenase non-catalytic subunit n=1 Tax=Petrolisthes cinctipes TaxID=88211 RepID=A0AAE1L4C2_PETCI|nr:hypothetical protein Pcinc_001640 [Petrolisthes cinctipes]